jgi:hypothetical protein
VKKFSFKNYRFSVKSLSQPFYHMLCLFFSISFMLPSFFCYILTSLLTHIFKSRIFNGTWCRHWYKGDEKLRRNKDKKYNNKKRRERQTEQLRIKWKEMKYREMTASVEGAKKTFSIKSRKNNTDNNGRNLLCNETDKSIIWGNKQREKCFNVRQCFLLDILEGLGDEKVVNVI